MKKIICTHLYNDFSGSPLVLSTVIKSYKNNGCEVEIITSGQSEGFLSNLDVKLVDNGYRYLDSRYLRLLIFVICQVRIFFSTLKYRNEDVVIYINTLLPFGAALAAKLIGKKVIYHFHETSLKPLLLKKFLKWIALKTADEIIYVSEFLKAKEGIIEVPSKVIYNTLSDDFVKKAISFQKPKPLKQEFVILMLCSLKTYKGVNEFVKLSRKLPDFTFNLVLNATSEEVDDFFKTSNLPKNLNLFPKQSNVHRFFQQAHLVLNLSHPDDWIETFGMTLLEGMQYGLPIIAPPVGGPTEIVFSDYNGYLIDQRNHEELVRQINKIASDKKLYKRLSKNAEEFAQKFTMKNVETEFLELIH